MEKFSVRMFLLWLSLNIIVVALMDLALFSQTTPDMKKASFLKKVGISELWATLQWVFLIPAHKIGNTFLSAVQISLASFLFDFLGQIVSNIFWLKVPTTIDDYTAMVIILLAMYAAKIKLFG